MTKRELIEALEDMEVGGEVLIVCNGAVRGIDKISRYGTNRVWILAEDK